MNEKSNSKGLYILVVVLLFALGVCISINIFMSRDNNKNNGDVDIINIDCNDENCQEEVKEKDKDNSKDKTTDTNKNNDNKDNSSNGSGSGTGTGNGGTSINNDGNGIENGSGTGGNNSTGQTGNFPGSGEESIGNGQPVLDENFDVVDKYHIWSQTTSLKIFDVDVIAPGDSGSYDFIINNNTSKNVEYNIDFDERNASNVNLMYKLKRNNEYVVGNDSEWIYYNDLDINAKVLNSRKNDSYTLEWKWVHSDHDTPAGRDENATYGLSILIHAEDTDKVDTTTGSGASFNPYTGDNVMYYIELALLSSIILVLLVIRRRQKD